MTSERWRRIENLYHAALECAPAQRLSFLRNACLEDPGLQQEVESLLEYDEPAGSFIETGPDEVAAQMLGEGALSPLIGNQISHYRILSTLGSGGMGEVYLAEDVTLGRAVAIKLLTENFTRDADRLRRFEQEARAASALNHPNILTIHEIGASDGRHFIVSEFVQGETLQARMARRRLELHEALEVALQTASALEAAHAAGIVHRDIKPENVMVRPDGLVKVLDFGLAKLAGPSWATSEFGRNSGAPALTTQSGILMGTVSYMSPEQARGLSVDHRSDIFSLGVMLYEMVTGHRPFEEETVSDRLAAILQKEPVQPSYYQPGLPRELDGTILRMLEKDCAARHQSALELRAELQSVQRKLVAPENAIGGEEPFSFGSSALSSLAPSPVQDSQSKVPNLLSASSRKHWRHAAIIGATVTLLLLVPWLWRVYRKPGPTVIAVLPFKNLSAEPDSEYFVDGLTDEIIRNLSLIEGLEVRSRTSSFTFKNKPRDIHEIGEQLKTNLVIEGSVLRSGGRLRVNAQLVRAADDTPLWSGRFDRELKDIFTIQDEISLSVVNELRLKLGRGRRRYDTNFETYELYLKARSLLGSALIPTAKVARSAQMFEQVIGRDPTFAPAYAGLANAYSVLSSPIGLRAPDPLHREAAFAKMRPAAERALKLDPLLAEAQAAMGVVYWREWDWVSAERAFRRATELNPNLTSAHLGLAYRVLCPTRRLEEALWETDRAIQVDPLSAVPWERRAAVLLNAGRYDDALESCRRALTFPTDTPLIHVLAKQYQARALLQKGKTTEAIAILEQFGEGSKAQLGYAYAITGRRAEAEALAAEFPRFPNRLAWIYAGLGDKDRVFEALEGMAAEKDPRVQLYLGYPELSLIRDDPRLATFRKKVGLQ